MCIGPFLPRYVESNKNSGWNDLQRSSSLLKAVQVKSSCSGSCLVKSRVTSSLWTFCYGKSLMMEAFSPNPNCSCSSLCPSSLDLLLPSSEKSQASGAENLLNPFFLRLNKLIPSGSPHSTCAIGPWRLCWPSTGLTPKCEHLSWTREAQNRWSTSAVLLQVWRIEK